MAIIKNAIFFVLLFISQAQVPFGIMKPNSFVFFYEIIFLSSMLNLGNRKTRGFVEVGEYNNFWGKKGFWKCSLPFSVV